MRIALTTTCVALLFTASALQARGPATGLADAAEQRRAQEVVTLLKQGADANAPQPDGATALHWAAHWNDVAMAKALIGAGANPGLPNDYGVTPLFLAATNGSADMLDVLLSGGGKASTALPSGETLLMAAVRSGQVAAVKRLLAAGADIQARQASKGQTALMWAASGDSPDIVKALIEGGADVKARTATGFTPLLFAAREGHLEASTLLLAAGADVNENAQDGTTPLLVAAVRGHAGLAMFFLERGAQPDGHEKAGYTALHWACNEYDSTPFTYKGIDPPGEWSTYYGIPDRAAKVKLIHALLDRGANIDAQTFKPLPLLAPHNGGGGVTPHVGATPFLTAAGSGDAEIMKLLLARGATPSIPAKDGYTPLMAAAEGFRENTVLVTEARRAEAIQVALDAGDDLEATDNRLGWRPIHIAAYSGYHDVIKFLLTKGADLNAKTRPGQGTGLGNFKLEAQTPLGLVEGTLNGIFYERPETAAFLRTLGAKSEGRFYPHDYEKIEKDNKTASKP